MMWRVVAELAILALSASWMRWMSSTEMALMALTSPFSSAATRVLCSGMIRKVIPE